jgi:hypothetical protein
LHKYSELIAYIVSFIQLKQILCSVGINAIMNMKIVTQTASRFDLDGDVAYSLVRDILSTHYSLIWQHLIA